MRSRRTRTGSIVPAILLACLALVACAGYALFTAAGKRSREAVSTVDVSERVVAVDTAGAIEVEKATEARPAIEGLERVEPAVSVDEATSSGGVSLLALAAEPTPGSVARLLRVLFSREDPRPAVAEILDAVAARELSLLEANVACLVLEASLEIYRSPAFRARFGPADGSDLAADVLALLPSMGDETAARLAFVLGEGEFLDESHRTILEAVLRRNPPPPWADRLAGAYARGAADGARFARDLLESDEPRLQEAALSYLMEIGGAGFLHTAREYLGRFADPERKLRFVEAIARGGEPQSVLSFLRETVRDSSTTDASATGAPYRRALGEALHRASPGVVREQIDLEPDPAIREMIVASLGLPYEDLLMDLARGTWHPDLRLPALVTLTTFRSDAEVGQILLDRLTELDGNNPGPLLESAARNYLRQTNASATAPVDAIRDFFRQPYRDRCNPGSAVWEDSRF